MGTCIRTLGVLIDGALWKYYIQVFIHFCWVDMNEMFEQVFRTKLCLKHRPLNLCQILELKKKARL